MADDRPVDDPAAQIAQLGRDLEDLRSTLLARLIRRPTGDVEPTVRTSAKPNTLILNGAAVSRTDYPDLWAWVQENSLVITGLFTVGDGSTTFGLPNMAGRVPVGAGTLGSDTYALGLLSGASTRVISTANMPAHDHNVSGGTTNSAGGHDHDGGTGAAGGNHGGHFPTAQFNAAAGPDLGVAAWNGGIGNTAHSHGVGSDGDHTHSLSISESTVGSGTAFDVRQASIAINWLVWT